MYLESRLYPPFEGEPFPISLRELKEDNLEVPGDGITLIPLRVRDSAAYLGLIDADREHLSQFGDNTANKYHTVVDVARSIAKPENPFRLRFGIWDDETMVGSINLEPIYSEEGNQAVIGYWIGKEHVRKHYATRALLALSRFAFTELGYTDLTAEVVRDNSASQGVLERAGFHNTGEIRGWDYETETGEQAIRQFFVFATKRPDAKTESDNCPPVVRSAIAVMDDLMVRNQGYNNAGTPSQVYMDLMKAGLVDSLEKFEEWLREMGSRVHFIAVPLDFYGPEWTGKTVSPSTEESHEPEYTLWVGVNGDREAREMLKHLGIDDTQNLERLKKTGMLQVQAKSFTFVAPKAPWVV